MRSSTYLQLRFAGFLAGLAVAGCGGGGGGSGSGYAIFSWSVADVQGTSLNCSDVAAGDVAITLTDAANSAAVYTQQTSCSPFEGSTQRVPTGVYYVGFDLYGDPKTYGNNNTVLDSFDVIDVNTGALATFHILSGRNDFSATYADFRVRSFDVGWTFSSGTALGMCAAVGVRYVDLAFVTNASTTTTITTEFNCTDGQGISLPYPYLVGGVGPTSASWALYLLDAAHGVIDQAGGTATLPPLTADPTDVNLGTVAFPY